MESSSSLNDIAVYGGYITDKKELSECTSGGIATALSKEMLRRGGYVAGVKYSDDFYSAEYALTQTEAELDKFKGSKYITVRKNNIYKDVKEVLDRGDEVLFFGLPCTVAGLKSFLKKEYDNLITCELVCHGPTYEKVHSEYIGFLESKYKSKVIDFSVRKKKDAWLPGYLYAEFQNGKIFEDEFYHTEYGFAFSVMGMPPCYGCKFKGNNRLGDIMLGDFWGADENDVFWNKDGVSLILARTERGNDFLCQADGIKLFETDFSRPSLENSMIIKSRAPRPEKQKFEKLFKEKGLMYAAHHAMTLKGRIVDFCFHITPLSLRPVIKKLYRK